MTSGYDAAGRPAGGWATRAGLVSLILLAAVSMAGRSSRAQSAPSAESAGLAESGEEETLRGGYVQVEKVQLVLVPVTVTDAKGRPVTDMRREDFQLLEEGRSRSIEYFAAESDAPVSIAFLLDLSGSMRQSDRLAASKRAISAFLDTLGPADEFGLIGFADEQVTWITEFTTDAALFKRRLDVQEGYGQTALYDALAASPGLIDASEQSRKAIILFTDGLDNSSKLAPLQAVQLARHVPVPIYTVGFTHLEREMLSAESQEALALLERFSRETGGMLHTVKDVPRLGAVADQIRQDLRSQYVIGFQPEPNDGDPRFRRLRLETTRKHLRIRCRTGYYPGP
ncbi:MAG TPA: VWA domain-containing protein [Candidatus Polarisedimenticolia bacterium]|nr:VWA domain-containing protein [Candidatus Polarisedimenticolia bacterium]